MTSKAQATRRLFLAGAALSAPLAAAGAASASGGAADDLKARLAALEDVGAIRALNAAYLRGVNARVRDEVAALFADPAQAALDPHVARLAAESVDALDAVEVSADRASAMARLACVADTETPITPSCPLVEMAREQGEGVVRRSERWTLELDYVRDAEGWKIARAELRTG
jgi:hypothetical protein